jgi:UTP--glucose-1-phosphate uridylyltransferase
MQHFFYLFTRYLTERAQSVDLYVSTFSQFNSFSTQLASFSDWDRIKSPSEDKIVPYADLPKPTDSKNLNKLAVLKVNGGLGTSMGSFLTIAPPIPSY